jgi:hypothetical protein
MRQTDSEEATAAGENLVERVLEVRCRLGDVAPDLLDVLFVALLDFLAEQLTECTVSQPFVAFLRMVRHEVGNERPSQPPGPL